MYFLAYKEENTKTSLTVGILHGLSLLGGFGDDFDHPAREGAHFLSVAQEESQQQAEMLPLVLVGDEQGLGAGKHLKKTDERRQSEVFNSCQKAEAFLNNECVYSLFLCSSLSQRTHTACLQQCSLFDESTVVCNKRSAARLCKQSQHCLSLRRAAGSHR